jgi:hypothetical protein
MFKNNLVASINVRNKTVIENNGIVKIPFDSEYSIYLKNLNSNRAVASITIDGEDIGHNIILDPNSSVEVERFIQNLDKGFKFKFIKKIDDIKKHRGEFSEDGLVRDEFRLEKPCSYGVYSTVNDWGKYIYRTPTEWHFDVPQTGDGTGNTGSSTISGNSYSIYSCNTVFPSDSVANTQEGITVPGSDSSQQFVPMTIGQLEEISTILTFKLTGYDSKNEYVKQAMHTREKYECKYCGKKNKSYHVFCYNCGARIV